MLDLREGGYSAMVCYQFDRAVASLCRRIEVRLAETDEVEVPAPRQPAKGHIWSRKPRYTLGQLLYDGLGANAVNDVYEEAILPEFADLPAAML